MLFLQGRGAFHMLSPFDMALGFGWRFRAFGVFRLQVLSLRAARCSAV